jgi:hypothetical protein
MGNKIAEALLSKMAVTDLQLLFQSENPDAHELDTLITLLVDQEAFDPLRALLKLLEKNDEPETSQLRTRIYTLLLTNAIKQSNKSEAIKILRALCLLLPKDKACWSDSISQLIAWINSANDPPVCSSILQNLSENPLELLYERLFETVDGKPRWLDSAIEFIVEYPRKSAHDRSLNQHLEKLASIILLSQASLSETQIQQLSLILTTESLIAATFQLRATAATYYSENKQNEPARFTEKRQFYLTHYETLLTTLTVRATASTSDYQTIVKGNSELANLLMSKRLNTLRAPKNQKTLINEILRHPEQFNWEDSQFNDLVIERLLNLFASLSDSELSLAFKEYFQYHGKKNIRGVIHFLVLLFAKTSIEKILKCINDNDDQDQTLTINLISQSNNRTPQLTEGLLLRLSASQLINLSGHVVALKQLLQKETEPLLIIYCRVLCSKIRALPKDAPSLIGKCSTVVSQLPDDAQDELITAVFAHFDKPTFQLMWLTALFDTPCNKNKLFVHCKALLKGLSLSDQERLLSCFSKEELLSLYLFMSRNHAQEQDFNCFIKLFTSSVKQPELIYFLLNTPVTEQPLLNNLLSLLDGKNLITLIEQLILQAQNDSSYRIKLEQILLHLCTLLRNTWDEKNPVHHWVECNSSGDIAYHLLASPVCFHSLSSRSSSLQNFTPRLLQGVVSHTASTDLKLRAARAFNLVQVDDEKADELALRLLSHFRHTYKDLHTIFVNLAEAQSSFDAQGKEAYACFLSACWRLLQAESSDIYDQERCTTLLTTQLGSPHQFDGVVARLASNLSENEDVYQGAHYLAQIEVKALAQINERTLATILLKSVQESTAENWQKISLYLNGSDVEKTINFIKALIAQCKNCQNNPLLTDNARLFILKLENFKSALPGLDDEELQWLIKECPADILMAQFPEWLDTLLAHPCRNTLNIGALLALVPSDLQFLDSLYQRPALIPDLHSLFIQFTRLDQCTTHLIALFQQISRQSEEAKRAFITRAQKEIDPQHMTMTAAPILNMLLLSLNDLNATKRADRELIDKQIHFFTKLAVNSPIDAAQRPQFIKNLQQLILNTFASLSSGDPDWAAILLNSQYFARSALIWLNDIEEKTIPGHPFTQIVMENAHRPIHTDLTISALYQHFIKCLLANPPASMNDDQFLMLFRTLNPANQKSLALLLLQRPTLDDVQWSSLIILSRVLEPADLYKIYEGSKTRFIFIDLLFRHPLGIDQLNNAQKNTLLDNVSSAKQVLRILDSQSPVATKLAFVNAIFNYLKQTDTPLLTWLLRLNVDAQTLAAFANFTAAPRYQQQLKEAITSNHYRTMDIQYYLQNPGLDMVIHREGLLYQFLEDAWVNPWSGWHCHPQLINALDTSTAKQGLAAQVQCLNQVHQLETFYEPLGSCHNVASESLTAARWILRLPLIGDGLLEILNTYQTTQNKETKAAIEKSKLYTLILAPFLTDNRLQCSLAILSEDIRELLADYLECTRSVNLNNQRIHAVYERYSQHIAGIEHFSFPRLINLFNPQSYFARVKNNSVGTLQQEEIFLLVNAREHHLRWLTERNTSPSAQFSKIVAGLLKNPVLSHDLSLQQWLFNCLLSPIADELCHSLLQQIMATLDVDGFAKQIEQTHSNLSTHEKSLQTLSELAETGSINEMLTTLLPLSSKQLALFLQATNFAFCSSLSALLVLVLQAKRLKISVENLQALYPSQQLTNGLELDWIHNDIKKLDVRLLQLSSRCDELAVAGYKYHANEKDSSRLVALADSFLKKKNIAALANCLNSYERAFEKHDTITPWVLQALSQLLTEPSVSNELVHHLHSSLIKRIITTALQNPEQNEFLLQQIIQAGWHTECRERLGAHLQLLLTHALPSESPMRGMDEHSSSQLTNLPPERIGSLFITQRLFFLIEPVLDLREWQQNGNSMPAKSRELFAADASMLATLITLEKAIEQADENESALLEKRRRLAYCFDLLNKKSLSRDYYVPSHSLTYEEPAVFYHWQCLLNFLSPRLICLPTNFIKWLRIADISIVANQHYLEKLLVMILDKNLLAGLCELLPRQPALEEQKSSWLFTAILRLQPIDDSLIHTIATACSWRWLALQIKTSEHHRFKLLTAALKEASHYQAIFLNEQSTLDFLALLTHCHLPPNELIDLLYSSPNSSLRSLIAFHLLSRVDYLQTIRGMCLLTEHDGATSRINRRLKPLTHFLELTSLSVSASSQLSPEAAMDLLCSVKHFHLLNEKRVIPLLHQIGSARDSFINYWVYQYATMPNSHEPLIVLIEKFPDRLLSTLTEMSREQRRPILFTLIQHIHRVNLITPPRLLSLVSLCNESHLTHAIQLYLHGGHNEALKALIIALVKSFLATDPFLSSPTIQLLVRLNEDPAFHEIQGFIGKATGDYLRGAALSDCSIFYDDDRINIKRLQELIPLSREQRAGEAQSGFFHNLLRNWNLLPSNPVEETSYDILSPENPLIAILKESSPNIKTINYFLIHYQGNLEKLSECLDDYIEYSNSSVDELHDTSWFMKREEISLEIRQVLFNCFLNHSNLVHGKIAVNLLKFNAEKVLLHFGKNYGRARLLELCEEALPLLKKTPQAASLVKRAKEEVEFEAAVTQISGFLASWRIWFKRCWFYGWSGWFTPKSPHFITLEKSVSPEKRDSTDIVIRALQNKQHKVIKLERLLGKIDGNAPLAKITPLYAALTLYEWEAHDESEYAIRTTVDELYEVFLRRACSEPDMDNWLYKHHQVFIRNRHLLIELNCRLEKADELSALLEKADKGPGGFHPIINELIETRQLERTQLNSAPIAQEPPSEEGLINGIVGSITSYFWPGAKPKPKEQTENTAPAPKKSGWLNAIGLGDLF